MDAADFDSEKRTAAGGMDKFRGGKKDHARLGRLQDLDHATGQNISLDVLNVRSSLNSF